MFLTMLPLLGYFLLFCMSHATSLEIEDCGSQSGEFLGVEISSCLDADNMEFCPLPTNTNGTLKINFIAIHQVTSVSVVVHGIIAGVPMPFALPNPNGCKHSGLRCPLVADTQYQYSATLPILSYYPKIPVDVRWILKDQNSNNILCIRIPTKIVSRPS